MKRAAPAFFVIAALAAAMCLAFLVVALVQGEYGNALLFTICAACDLYWTLRAVEWMSGP